MSNNVRNGANILGSHIDALSWEDTINTICGWARNRESRYVTLCNVHSVVTALLEDDHRNDLNAADMATSDGMPVTWTLRKLGFPEQQRINGPDLMWKYCEKAAKVGHKVFFYGSTDTVLSLLEIKLRTTFPELQIVGMYSPPFRELTAAEDDEVVERLNASEANVVFIGLGCPRQERWMFQHRGKINAVMIGVGAAFNYHAGTTKRAPLWMQNAGLEWLHRLAADPKRLWRRYFVTNSIFILAITAQLLGIKKFQD
ncbi:WecB/TagA/CpsF family glycosyltransferase [Methylotenera sp.]|uniref:WecB/TagA/CpsF family glycosyltransferase n=1 Tax=Methylotenera sp. TaxID=2051956 RepID=UPI002730A383|nr:WecB/TagA/CpsF family glycosyltransferase [Methylotenera sp.]MDP2231486.1 WecB/TagA/CpsF family glycosyltransferase [Methylotenera sp.]